MEPIFVFVSFLSCFLIFFFPNNSNGTFVIFSSRLFYGNIVYSNVSVAVAEAMATATRLLASHFHSNLIIFLDDSLFGECVKLKLENNFLLRRRSLFGPLEKFLDTFYRFSIVTQLNLSPTRTIRGKVLHFIIKSRVD